MKKNILIIEDEHPMAKILQMKLQHEGINVDVAFNGGSGLSMMRDNSYDLIVLDLIMPVLDGFHVLETMQKEGINVPTIVASNLSQNGDEQRSRELGAVGYFIKSNTSLKDLVENIKNHLSR